jgi:hypothetical protein
MSENIDQNIDPNKKQQLESVDVLEGNTYVTTVPYHDPSSLRLYTIPQGTILYHGSNFAKTFNPLDIKLGKDSLVSFFSPNKAFAADYITSCQFSPGQDGYIHTFRAKTDIPRIYIMSNYEINEKDLDPKTIENKFCNSTPNKERFNGIGIFSPLTDRNVEDISSRIQNGGVDGVNTDLPTVNLQPMDNPMNNPENVIADSEFALCDPAQFLEYVLTQRCVARRKLSQPYNFYT